jgi:hypothetical protein
MYTLYFNGVISDETWWGDEVTPKYRKKSIPTAFFVYKNTIQDRFSLK